MSRWRAMLIRRVIAIGESVWQHAAQRVGDRILGAGASSRSSASAAASSRGRAARPSPGISVTAVAPLPITTTRLAGVVEILGPLLWVHDLAARTSRARRSAGV